MYKKMWKKWSKKLHCEDLHKMEHSDKEVNKVVHLRKMFKNK